MNQLNMFKQILIRYASSKVENRDFHFFKDERWGSRNSRKVKLLGYWAKVKLVCQWLRYAANMASVTPPTTNGKASTQAFQPVSSSASRSLRRRTASSNACTQSWRWRTPPSRMFYPESSDADSQACGNWVAGDIPPALARQSLQDRGFLAVGVVQTPNGLGCQGCASDRRFEWNHCQTIKMGLLEMLHTHAQGWQNLEPQKSAQGVLRHETQPSAAHQKAPHHTREATSWHGHRG